MKQIINHINKAGLSLILISGKYSGETIVDSFLSYCLDRLFYVFNKKVRNYSRPIAIISVTFGLLLSHQNIIANCACAKSKSCGLYPPYAKVKIIVDLEKRRDRLRYYEETQKRNQG
ncbi:hypothetical protein [Mucilaginibacter sp.]